MKWIRFTLDTHTDAVDMLSYMLDEIGVEGIEIEDHVPLSEEDKKKMFKNEVKKCLKDICRNSYISKNKKIQACIFAYSLSLYKVIVKTIK